MHPLKRILILFSLVVLSFSLAPAGRVQALPARPRPLREVTAYDLILAINTLRVSYGNPALVEDPIINAVAQATAEIMAANQMSWHMGDVSGRVQAAGFGGGSKVWATENFAVGGNHTIDTIMVVWADESHMIPVVNAAYCAVGAGVAKSSNGMTYYVLQAAYTSGQSCGEYTSSSSSGGASSGTTGGAVSGVSQLIVPVAIATADAEGKIYHEVKAGQSLWAIAIAYQITINDITTWNNITKDTKLQVGQKLFIPGENTEGYATPTPAGWVSLSTPQPDGRIVHVVQAYNTLSTIALAYQVDMNTLLALNNLQEDWALQIGQELLVRGPLVTPSPTPLPLTPLQKLTPAADGKYYHEVNVGETLSWIADQYKVAMTALMSWNGLTSESILQPGQKLLLQVTPPATITPTPLPPTQTPTVTQVPPSATPSPSATSAASLTPTPQPSSAANSLSIAGTGILGAALIGLALILLGRRKRT